MTAGCGASGEHDLPVALLGWAIAGNPLVGATVTAVGDDGKAIAPSGRTLANGTWHLRLEHPPKSFTLVASGGTDGGRPFHGRLKYVVRAYDHHNPRPLHVNPATTLVATYLAEHPRATAEAAEARVATFLGIPKQVDFQSSLRVTDRWFSGAEFLRQAKAGGGIGPFVTTLDHELAAGTKHAFHGPPSNQTGLGSALTALGALGKASPLFSIGFGIVGMINGFKQTAALQNIESTLSSLKTELDGVKVELDDALAAIDATKYQTQLDNYDSSVSSADDLVGELTKYTYPAYEYLLSQIGVTGGDVPDAVAAFEKTITENIDLFDNNKAGGGTNGLDSMLVIDEPGNPGALGNWAAMAGTATGRFITYGTQRRASQAISYWLNIEAQVLAVDGAYEDLMNNASILYPTSTNASTTVQATTTLSSVSTSSTAIDLGTAAQVAVLAGQAADDAEAQCQASGGPTDSTTNLVLNQLNASHSCFEALPDDTTNGPFYSSYGKYELTMIDQATSLMWQDSSGNAPQPFDGTGALGFQYWGYGSGAFPDISSPGWSIPSKSDFDTLTSLNQGSWNLTGQYTNPLDMLADYALLPFFKELQTLYASQGLPQSDSWITTFWTSTALAHPGIGSHVLPNTDQIAYDIATDKYYMMCPATNPDYDSYDGGTCATDMDAWVTGTGYYKYGAYYSAHFSGGHKSDAADTMIVRTVTSGEIYGGS